jgi:Leucine-rich repeat (LRR) protein
MASRSLVLRPRTSVSNSRLIVKSASSTPAPLRADIKVKIGIAAGSGKLDLSDCDLEVVPDEVFELTDLVELSLAGNNLSTLTDGFGKLKSLEKLQLSGNRLTVLPDSVCELESLEGLWLHGNLLESLPTDIGSLLNLRQMAVAGNRLTRLPDSIGLLTSLVELVAAGNLIEQLPKSIGTMSACRILDLHGNRLTCVPETIGLMEELQELWLQGNPTLRALPRELGQCRRLKKLSVADCGLENFEDKMAIPAELGGLEELVDVSAYGNKLVRVPVELVQPVPGGSKKKKLWLEGNPLEEESVMELLDAACMDSSSSTVGLDASQLSSRGLDADMATNRDKKVMNSTIIPNTQGYFKLERHLGAHASPTDPSPVLIVAFGSAPGTPNWGGALRRVREDFDSDSQADVNYDILYVVDPERSWYHGGDDRFREYDETIASVAATYDHVLFVGDSMGATACLLFAKHADVVHAFCPQIDLGISSIRPGQDTTWESIMKSRVLDGIAACKGQIYVHVGNWHHDIQQVHPVQADHAFVKIYGIDSHRLAIALERSGKLLRILQGSILGFYGRMSSESMNRVSNYL